MNSSSRWRIVNSCSSAKDVIGWPSTYSMTKYGLPVSVAPASMTRATLGWSISAKAWRSDSKRAMTWRVSMPSLMSLTAHGAPDRVALLRAVHRAHPAFTDQLLDVVAPDLRRTLPVADGGEDVSQVIRAHGAS